MAKAAEFFHSSNFLILDNVLFSGKKKINFISGSACFILFFSLYVKF